MPRPLGGHLWLIASLSLWKIFPNYVILFLRNTNEQIMAMEVYLWLKNYTRAKFMSYVLTNKWSSPLIKHTLSETTHNWCFKVPCKNQLNCCWIPGYMVFLYNIWISFTGEAIVNLWNVVVRDLAQWQKNSNQEMRENNNLENNGWKKSVNTK